MTHAIRVHRTGGPEVLQWDAIEVGKPGLGEVRLRHTTIGVDYADIYYRTGVYPTVLPVVPGHEAVGIVEEVGTGVNDVSVGDRIAYVTQDIGAYAEARLIHSRHLVKLPTAISDDDAAAVILKGMTVRYLVRETYDVQPDDIVLVHAAAGGVGLILCQWLKHLGAIVIGTVSNEHKAELAKANGCAHAIDYTREDFVQRVSELTDGRKVSVVYDSIGKDTFTRSLDCLAPEGVMVVFGHTSGKVTPFDLMILATKGSLYVTRPTLWSRLKTSEDLASRANEVFSKVGQGILRINVGQTYPLREARRAQIDLEARKTVGATILKV